MRNYSQISKSLVLAGALSSTIAAMLASCSHSPTAKSKDFAKNSFFRDKVSLNQLEGRRPASAGDDFVIYPATGTASIEFKLFNDPLMAREYKVFKAIPNLPTTLDIATKDGVSCRIGTQMGQDNKGVIRFTPEEGQEVLCSYAGPNAVETVTATLYASKTKLTWDQVQLGEYAKIKTTLDQVKQARYDDDLIRYVFEKGLISSVEYTIPATIGYTELPFSVEANDYLVLTDASGIVELAQVPGGKKKAKITPAGLDRKKQSHMSRFRFPKENPYSLMCNMHVVRMGSTEDMPLLRADVPTARWSEVAAKPYCFINIRKDLIKNLSGSFKIKATHLSQVHLAGDLQGILNRDENVKAALEADADKAKMEQMKSAFDYFVANNLINQSAYEAVVDSREKSKDELARKKREAEDDAARKTEEAKVKAEEKYRLEKEKVELEKADQFFKRFVEDKYYLQAYRFTLEPTKVTVTGRTGVYSWTDYKISAESNTYLSQNGGMYSDDETRFEKSKTVPSKDEWGKGQAAQTFVVCASKIGDLSKRIDELKSKVEEGRKVLDSVASFSTEKESDCRASRENFKVVRFNRTSEYKYCYNTKAFEDLDGRVTRNFLQYVPEKIVARYASTLMRSEFNQDYTRKEDEKRATADQHDFFPRWVKTNVVLKDVKNLPAGRCAVANTIAPTYKRDDGSVFGLFDEKPAPGGASSEANNKK